MSDGKCPECGLPIYECNERALARWRHRGDQTKEIASLRSELAEYRFRAAFAGAERNSEAADADRAEAELAAAREVISDIVKRWDSEEDRDGNERYSGMAMYEDMEPEMKKARAFLERTATASVTPPNSL